MTQLALVVDDPRQRSWLENQLVKASHYVLLSCSADELEVLHGRLGEKPQIWLVLLPATRIERALGYISAVSEALQPRDAPFDGDVEEEQALQGPGGSVPSGDARL